jgi:glucose-1-phosphate thymidylyltransferase
MEVLILAAGYATRLYPLTEQRAKPLLPVGDRRLLDHLSARLVELEGVTRWHIVANNRFHADFVAWARQHPLAQRITVYNDGTFENADRLGAIGDAEYVIRTAQIADDLLIVAGDNLFEFDLRDLRAFQLAHGSSIVTYHFPDRERLKGYSVVEVDAEGRVTSFVEKPQHPGTDLMAICCYLLSAAHVPKVSEYLSDGNNPDAPGFFIQWLHKQVPVYAFEFAGMWYDIGDLQSLTEADNELRRRGGLPPRECYALV